MARERPPLPEGAARLENAVSISYSGRRRLLIVALAGFLVMVVEVIGATLTGSLVLLADAAHYFADLGAVLLAYAATSLAVRPPSRAKTFGYHRAEVIAALLNAIVLWALVAYFSYEAYRRLRDPPEIGGLVVLGVGLFTFLADAGMALLLREGSASNLSLRSAYVNLVSDAAGSIAVMAAGAFAYLGWRLADPVFSILVILLIGLFAFRLSRETLHILMEGAPAHLNLEEIATELRAIPPIRDVHDLHIWTLSPGVESLSVHVVLDEAPRDDRVLHAVQSRLWDRFRLRHTTVQVEDPTCLCDMARHPLPAG